MIAFFARFWALLLLSETPKTPPPPPRPKPPTRPPTKPPKRGLVEQVAAVRRLTMGAALVLRLVEPPASASARDRAALADRLEIAAACLRDARAALDAAHAMAQWIADCQLLDQVDVIRADLESPARQVSSRGVAPGGPVQPPVAAGKGPTPGPAVAADTAACGSGDGATNTVVAGAVSGRGGEVPGSEPARPGRFTLPLRPAVPRFDAELLGRGPLYDALPAPQVGVAEYGTAR